MSSSIQARTVESPGAMRDIVGARRVYICVRLALVLKDGIPAELACLPRRHGLALQLWQVEGLGADGDACQL